MSGIPISFRSVGKWFMRTGCFFLSMDLLTRRVSFWHNSEQVTHVHTCTGAEIQVQMMFCYTKYLIFKYIHIIIIHVLTMFIWFHNDHWHDMYSSTNLQELLFSECIFPPKILRGNLKWGDTFHNCVWAKMLSWNYPVCSSCRHR